MKKIILILIIPFLSFCSMDSTQVRAINHFSNSTIIVTDLAAEEVLSMRQSIIDMNLARIELVGVKNGEPDYRDLDGILDVEPVEIRLKAIHSLRSYGNLLQTLSDKDSSGDIESATESFVHSIQSLSGEQKSRAHLKIGDKQLQGIGEAIKLIGITYTNYKKKVAIKTILINSKNQIDALCDLLLDEFNEMIDGSFASQYLLTTEMLTSAADDSYKKSKSQLERERSLKLFNISYYHKNRRKTVLKKISNSILILKSANQELYDSFKQDHYSDPKKITELINMINSVQNLRKVLK